MNVELYLKSIEEVRAEALFMPVDGDFCALGGGAMRGLKSSMQRYYEPDEWMKKLEDLERAVSRIAPIPHGSAKIFQGDGDDYDWLVIAACQPHNVNGRIFTPREVCGQMESALFYGMRKCFQEGIKSVALTLMNTGSRITVEQSMQSIVNGLVASQTEPVTVRWVFWGEGPGKENQKENCEQAARLLFSRGVTCEIIS